MTPPSKRVVAAPMPVVLALLLLPASCEPARSGDRPCRLAETGQPASTSPAYAGHAVPTPLPGFEKSPHFGERIRAYTAEPEVHVSINAPSEAEFDRRRPTRLILYALPNGNTTAQTIGKTCGEGVDWHFGIQHIGAQVRRLREVNQRENLVVVYLEAEGKSWPAWRKKYPDADQRIGRLVDELREEFPEPVATVDLSAHSGGGSFLFGFINSAERIADGIGRIAFLDANYGYSDEQRHGDKLIEWLQRDPKHFLCVIAYDDRNVRLDGKLIVGPDGGTYRKTYRMIEKLSGPIELTSTPVGAYTRYRGLGGRAELIVHDNPENAILHTLLVGEKNGFIHAMTCGTDLEGVAAVFNGPVAYEKWIQPD